MAVGEISPPPKFKTLFVPTRAIAISDYINRSISKRTTFPRSERPTANGTIVGRHIGELPSVRRSGARNVVQIRDSGRRVLQYSDSDHVISAGIVMI